MNLDCRETSDDMRSRHSLKKLFARTSDVMSHRTIVRRRRESKPLALPAPWTCVLAMKRWRYSISANLFALKHLAFTTHRAAAGS